MNDAMDSPGWYILGPDGDPVGPVDYETYVDAGRYLIERRRVALSVLDDGSRVSTVFLGLDHNWYPEGPPLLFETMAFDPDGNDVECERTPNRHAALACHDRILAELQQLRSP